MSSDIDQGPLQIWKCKTREINRRWSLRVWIALPTWLFTMVGLPPRLWVHSCLGYYQLWVCRPRALLPGYDRPHFRSGNGSILLLIHSNVMGYTLQWWQNNINDIMLDFIWGGIEKSAFEETSLIKLRSKYKHWHCLVVTMTLESEHKANVWGDQCGGEDMHWVFVQIL